MRIEDAKKYPYSVVGLVRSRFKSDRKSSFIVGTGFIFGHDFSIKV